MKINSIPPGYWVIEPGAGAGGICDSRCFLRFSVLLSNMLPDWAKPWSMRTRSFLGGDIGGEAKGSMMPSGRADDAGSRDLFRGSFGNVPRPDPKCPREAKDD